MPELTRRRNPERPDCWHVYYGDVRVGSIAQRTGNPPGTDPWEWLCGFYPGSHPGERRTTGTAATFDQARAKFEDAWRVFLSNRTGADFQEWRDFRDRTAEKYAMWAAGEPALGNGPIPVQTRKSNSRNRPASDLGRDSTAHTPGDFSDCVPGPHQRAGRMRAPRGWQRLFEPPIPLPRGRQIVTLEDAARYIQRLPKAEQQIEEWQAAIEAMILVAEHGGPTMMARIGVMRALNRDRPPPGPRRKRAKAYTIIPADKRS